MKKQVLSLLLAGALTLGLFGCSAQTPEESGVPPERSGADGGDGLRRRGWRS